MEQLHLPADRDARLAAIAQYFPDATGPDAPIHGGPIAARSLLTRVNPVAYGRSRNHLRGAVTRLSPIRALRSTSGNRGASRARAS